MAVKLMFLLLLLDFTLLIHNVTSLCNVTCTTDYKTSVNCSCSGAVPSYPILLEANCRYGEDVVNGSCEVKLPQSWCVMYPKDFEDITSVSTDCITNVHHQNDHVGKIMSESSSWALYENVRPSQPFNVQVANGDGFFNITWDIDNDLEEPLEYTVRIRASKDLDPVHSLLVNQNFMMLYDEKLQPQTKYNVDVQAKMSPQAAYLGPWSEWSSPVELETAGKTEGIELRWLHISLYISLSVISVLFLIMLGYSQKLSILIWLKRLGAITYIPDPNVFFEPLSSTHRWNFEDWVRPVFTEYDVLMINTPLEVISKKQQDVLHWTTVKQSYGEDDTKEDGCFLHNLQPHCASTLHCKECDSFHRTGHSTGHISIHTVTLSGEEEEENGSRSSINGLRSYQAGENFGFEEENREHVGYDLEEPQVPRPHRQGRILPDMNFQQQAQFIEEERVSLDSFVSNEQSEDGYPRVDLDTIDSGFGEPECRSPAASDSCTAEQKDSDLFHENSNSNYVKQWMICSTLQENSTLQEDSLASNKQSEDGCHRIDLDTIDSGFGEPECRSPAASESSTAEQTDSDLFHENSNSIYVKQWMICSTLEEDPSDSTDELPKTL